MAKNDREERGEKEEREEHLDTPEPISTELSDEEVVQIFEEIHKEAEDAYRPIRDVADTAWDAYNNAFDFSDKSDAQSQSFLPIYKSAVRIAKSVVRRTLLATPQYFAVEGLTSQSKELELDVQETLFRAAEQSHFRQKVSDAAFGGFLENLAVLKNFPVLLQEEDDLIHPQQQIKIVSQPISVPNDFRLDPTGRNLYVLHRSLIDLADYELLVESGDYTKKSLEMAKADFIAKDEEQRKLREQGLTDSAKPSWRKTVELWEVWTRALCRMDGTAIQRNVMFTVLNRKHLARKVTPYLYRHNKPPFVWSPVADKPFSVYHENFGEPVLSILDAIIDLLNSLVDAARNVATKGFEVSLDQVKNIGELQRGIYGGKVIKTVTPPIPGLNAIRPFDVGEFSSDAYQFMMYLVQQFQNGIGVTELISGIPGVGEKTATEITSKTRAAMQNLNEVAGMLDENLIGPSLQMYYKLLLEWNPEVFGDRLAFQTNRENLRFRFNISGISGAMKQEGDLEQLMFIIKTLMSTPLAPRINWTKVGEEMLRRKGFDPKAFLIAAQVQPPEVGVGGTPTEIAGAEAVANVMPPQGIVPQ